MLKMYYVLDQGDVGISQDNHTEFERGLTNERNNEQIKVKGRIETFGVIRLMNQVGAIVSLITIMLNYYVHIKQTLRS